MSNQKSTEKNPLPVSIRDFIVAFMRGLNTVRLYSSDHALFKEQSQHLSEKLAGALAHRNLLFLGLAKDTLFLDGVFHQIQEPHLQKFLNFFHLLRISHILLDKDATLEEIETFLELLAGARQGQGDEVSSALVRENIKRVQVGLLDYSVFSSVETISAQLAHADEDQALWRQLILLPAGTEVLDLNPEQIRQLLRICEDMEEFKKLLQQMDTSLDTSHAPAAPKGTVLANLIRNLDSTLARIAPDKRDQFARQVYAVLESLEPKLRLQILDSVSLDAVEGEDGNVVLEVFRAMPDDQMVSLLTRALEEGGAESPYFVNIFRQALAKYGDPTLILTLVRKEMHRATQGGAARHLKSWQYLEQLVVQRQETEGLNEKYRKEIEALKTSLHLEVAFAGDQELDRLLQTMTPGSLRAAGSELIIHLLGQQYSSGGDDFLAPMLQNFGDTLAELYREKEFETIGNLIRQALLTITGHPQEKRGREIMESLLSTEDIRELLDNLLDQCQTYEATETVAIGAVCQLYPEKAAAFLLDVLEELEGQESEKTDWLLTTLAGLGSEIFRPVGRKLQSGPDHLLFHLLTLVELAEEERYVHFVVKLLEHRDPEIRLRVITTLGKLGTPRAVPHLAEILQKRSWLKKRKDKELQEAAAQALSTIGTDEAKSVLQETADQGSGDLKEFCRQLLK